jgi:RNA polymerase sigma-70 factor (ECF subfamily)
MEHYLRERTNTLVSLDERTRLVQLCAHIVGDREVAEDLAQETLFEAWRHEQALRDPQRRSQWLSGIARNVCRRWIRQRGYDSAHLLTWDQVQEDQNALIDSLENVLVDDFDLEVELERKELVELLERAMALLPEETRTVLIKRYVEDSPLSQVAAQLGTTTSAVAMRLQRGKLALKRVLTTTLQQELAPYALQASTSDDWEETPLWCHLCGLHRLRGKRNPAEGELLLKCPVCDVWSVNHLPALRGVKGYRPLYARLAAWCNNYYQIGLNNGTIPCAKCGRMLRVNICLIEEIPTWALQKGMIPGWYRETQDRLVSTTCSACHCACNTSLDSFALMLPEGRLFLQSYPRVRTLPYQRVETQGRETIVTRFESITENAPFTLVFDSDTYQVLSILREGSV